MNNWSKYFFVLGAPLCLILRIFLIFTNMNPETGFYLTGGFGVSFYHTLLILCLGIIIFHGLFKMKPRDFSVRKPALLSLASAFCGMMILLTSGFSFLDFLGEMFRWSDPVKHLLGSIPTAVWQLVRLLIGLSAGSNLLSYAIAGGKLFRRSALLMTTSIWTMIYAVEQFMALPQIADMSDRVLWMLTLLFFSLAMIGQARIIRNVKPEKGAKYLCAYGFSCAFCGLVLGISQIVTLQRVCTIDTMQWVLTTSMGLHALVMALSCHCEGDK